MPSARLQVAAGPAMYAACVHINDTKLPGILQLLTQGQQLNQILQAEGIAGKLEGWLLRAKLKPGC